MSAYKKMILGEESNKKCQQTFVFKKHRKHGFVEARGGESERLVESRSLRNPMTCCRDLPQQLSRLPLRLHVSNLTCVTISSSNFVNNNLLNLHRPIKTGAPASMCVI